LALSVENLLQASAIVALQALNSQLVISNIPVSSKIVGWAGGTSLPFNGTVTQIGTKKSGL